MQWYEWYLKISIRLCDRGCRDNGLGQMLRSHAAVEIVTNFVLGLRRSRDVLMARSIRHVFALVQLSWLSCPLGWHAAPEDTDSEARTLRELNRVSLACSPNDTGIDRPCLLDLACSFLYCHQARIHIARTRGYFLTPKQDNDETGTHICSSKGTDDTADETNGLQRQLDWSLFSKTCSFDLMRSD